MSGHTENRSHLALHLENDRLRRALAARFDMTLRRAGVSSARAAKRLGVSEDDVRYWRRGITVPPLNVCTSLAAALNLDVHWLCTGQSRLS